MSAVWVGFVVAAEVVATAEEVSWCGGGGDEWEGGEEDEGEGRCCCLHCVQVEWVDDERCAEAKVVLRFSILLEMEYLNF